MTIGSAGHDPKDGPNPDFVCLVECARSLEEKTGIPLKLSFGMSDDFEHAVSHVTTKSNQI